MNKGSLSAFGPSSREPKTRKRQKKGHNGRNLVTPLLLDLLHIKWVDPGERHAEHPGLPGRRSRLAGRDLFACRLFADRLLRLRSHPAAILE